MPGKGKVTKTGKLGDVMQESIEAAENYVKSRAPSFGIKPTAFDKADIHVHVPEGATPKDGPSAGVAMVSSIVSVLTGVPVRHDVAMTGEITLRGRVLPIGGLKEKLLAALRGGIKSVLIPRENEKDLADIPAKVRKGLEIVSVSTVDELLEHALTESLKPIEWNPQIRQGRRIGSGFRRIEAGRAGAPALDPRLSATADSVPGPGHRCGDRAQIRQIVRIWQESCGKRRFS